MGDVMSDGNMAGNTDVRKRILAVDDDPTMLKTIKLFLGDLYDVRVVTSGIKAVESLGKFMPDMILLDFEMPEVNGRQTLEMIRSGESFSDIPVVFLTGDDDSEHERLFASLDIQGYLLKPLAMDKLRDEVRKVLETKA